MAALKCLCVSVLIECDCIELGQTAVFHQSLTSQLGSAKWGSYVFVVWLGARCFLAGSGVNRSAVSNYLLLRCYQCGHGQPVHMCV